MRTGRLARAFDWPLAAAALCLVTASAVTMVSAASKVNPDLAWRQARWILLGLAAMVGIARLGYRRWTDLAPALYVLGFILLVMVEIAGATRLGAARWLSIFGLSLQPSEIMKLTTVCLLARYLAGRAEPLPMKTVGVSLIIAGIPALLIFLQPDLGTATIFGAIWLGMAWAAGMNKKVLWAMGGAMLVLLPLGWHVLRDYQRDRLLVFLNPHIDPLGAGYTIIQSTIAIGSGQLFGRGWLAGTQNQLSFLPERHSDFIYSVVGEEWGLMGCLAVIACFMVLLSRCLRVAATSPDPQGRLLAVGVAMWFAYQAFVNMGMVMGVLPVVGVPLPLMSYGGTSMVFLCAALGLVQSVHRTSVEG